MLARESHLYTLVEYLTLEERAESKSEYHQGRIVAMAGASLAHNQIAGNIHAALHNALQTKPCGVFMSDLRSWIASAKCAVYPDIMVICGDSQLVEGRTDTVTNPTLIIEVLSKFTAEDDRSDKFQAYWTLDTFEEYILVDQYRLRVEYFRRESEKLWELLVFTQPHDILTLKSIGAQLPLAQIYQGVQWEA